MVLSVFLAVFCCILAMHEIRRIRPRIRSTFLWTEYHVFYRYSMHFILVDRIPYFVKNTEYGQNTDRIRTEYTWKTYLLP